MKVSGVFHVLLTAEVFGIAATATGPLHDASEHFDNGDILTIQKNFNGWVNPEDLVPMPQCIAQQDQSAWLKTMTACTHLRCTSHFGIICTHRQWLTELSCLSTEFSPSAIKPYLPYCSRSILAKAQLYHWIRNATGRRWLVDVGDANRLQNLWPSSLIRGIANFDVAYKAPECLANSLSVSAAESFQHVLASCSFTDATQHTGNANRPWEYSKPLRSMTALSFDTVGYDLTGGHIRPGEYFDRECFCSTFTIGAEREPCPASDPLDLTMERLWLNATCGSASLPGNWTAQLKMMGFTFIPVPDWHWPTCVSDMPRRVTDLTDQCATDACQLDPDGYCQTGRAIDRACFCRNIEYDSCQGSCQTSRTRIDYVEWLHDLCDDVEGWHGLPTNWRELTVLLPREMIPWRWAVKPTNSSNVDPIAGPESGEAEEKCASNGWKLGSIVLVNVATLLAAFLDQGRGEHLNTVDSVSHSQRLHWPLKGILLAGLPLLANWFNARIVQSTPGYGAVPVFQLALLWCSLPQPDLSAVLPSRIHWHGAKLCSSTASSVVARVILQVPASYHMFLTVDFARRQVFNLDSITNARKGHMALLMYIGALIWLLTVAASFIEATRYMYRIGSLSCSDGADLPDWHRRKYATANNQDMGIFESLLGQPQPRMPPSRKEEQYTEYGTFSSGGKENKLPQKMPAMLFTVVARMMPFVWIAQWLFWVGFIGLSSEEFCLPKLEVLTTIWVAASIGDAAIRSYL
ncbi:hypothetical protein NCS57_01450200 [Fusarium keratoplasticum]|uniref:Uncharacterized protein n=1 Tax=Fusarium keratoplasticum TaxID=1328300 RepID=A0ACC0QDB7_9HYPO|nr:hypothetical protein NCS57_01450200 [Fusarium keratoplasticum]KAI8649141.1 hypothetical protein NCS57_01450200 [Fusarium keratoplasticum]KAI8649538.1 hypothetical protein NCS55_01453800 [Fusarium keratoplasticum]